MHVSQPLIAEEIVAVRAAQNVDRVGCASGSGTRDLIAPDEVDREIHRMQTAISSTTDFETTARMTLGVIRKCDPCALETCSGFQFDIE